MATALEERQLCRHALASIGFATIKAIHFAARSNPELADAVPRLRNEISPGDVIVLRKPHLAYYMQADSIFMPEIATVSELQRMLAETAAQSEGSVFLFYGTIERARRPELEAVLADANRPPWLHEIARGADGNGWFLYRYMP